MRLVLLQLTFRYLSASQWEAKLMDTQTLILIVAPLIVIQLSLQIWALYDIWKRKGAKTATPVWVVIVVLFQIFGALAYFILGRKEAEA
jgi:hypothetical protein